MEDLCETEIETLRVAAGQDVPGFIQGAASNAALGYLKGRGFVTGAPHYRATEAGKYELVLIDQQSE